MILLIKFKVRTLIHIQISKYNIITTRTCIYSLGLFSRWKGIEDIPIKRNSYWQKLNYFHSSPVARISYDFVSNTFTFHHVNILIFSLVDLYMVFTCIQLYDVISHEI